MTLRSLALAAAILLALPAALAAQEGDRVEIPDVPPRPEDVATVDGIVRAFYEVISGPAGQPRDWGRDATLYLPGVTFTPTSEDSSGTPRGETITKDEFVHRTDGWLVENGPTEREIGRATTRFGNLAHVWSAYEWRTDDGETGRGVNSIELWNDGARWWILNASWDDERPDAPIPAEFLEPPPEADGRAP